MPQPLRLLGLFIDGLRRAHVVADRRQDLLGVVAQLRFAHRRAGRHQGFGEDRELADDLFVMVVG